MTNYETTSKVKKLIDLKTKDHIAKEIGISRPTLDARLSFHRWKKSEIALIKSL